MKEKNTTQRVSEHIKQFRNKNSTRKKLTQQEAADALGISLPTLKRYEKGETAPSESYARDMEKETGIIYKYWMGETECKSWNEYYAEIEKTESQGANDYIKAKSEELEQRRILFNRCGYHYKFLDGTVYDFAECSPTPDSSIIYHSYHPHQLTSFEEPDKHYYFNQEELDDLISQMKDMIVLACFKKERATQQMRGGSQNGD